MADEFDDAGSACSSHENRERIAAMLAPPANRQPRGAARLASNPPSARKHAEPGEVFALQNSADFARSAVALAKQKAALKGPPYA